MTAQVVALLTSVITLASMWLAGNQDRRGWILGGLNQVLWFAFIVLFAAWGLLPLNLALAFTYTRNYLKWRRDDE